MFEKLILALAETKFKTKIAKMYYYGTEAEAKMFVKKLKQLAISKDSE